MTRAAPLEGPAVALSKRVAKANHPTGASLPAEPTTAPPPHEFTFVPFDTVTSCLPTLMCTPWENSHGGDDLHDGQRLAMMAALLPS